MRPALLSLLLAALAALTVWSVAARPAAPMPQAPDPAAASPRAACEQPDVRTSRTHAIARAALAPRADAAVESGSADAATAGPESLTGVIREVRVVAAGSGAPVPGAEVWWGSLPTAPRGRPGEATRFDWNVDLDQLAHLRRAGRRAVADAGGVAEISVGPGTELVVASGAESFGQRVLVPAARAASSPLVIETMPERSVRVRAVSRDGRRVAGVAIALRRPRTPMLSGGPTHRSLPVGTTDARGELTVRHFQRMVAGDRVGPVSLVVDVPGADPVGVAIDPLHLPRNAVRLMVPATGALRVRVVDAAGAPRFDASVRLAAAQRSRWARSAGFGHACHAGWTDARGEVVFPRVALGALCELRVRSGPIREVRRIHGPASSGREGRVEVVLGRRVVTVAGTVRDRDGNAYRHRLLRLEYDCDARPGAAVVRSDAHGAFCFELPASLVGTIVRDGLVRLLGDDRAMTWTSLALPELRLDRASVELGELVLGDAPVIAAGQLTGAVPGPGEVGVVLERRQHDRETGALEWRRAEGVELARFQDGAFEFRGRRAVGPIDNGRYRLRVVSRGIGLTEPVEFAAGRRDLTIALARAPETDTAVAARSLARDARVDVR